MLLFCLYHALQQQTYLNNKGQGGTFLVVNWLRLHISTAGHTGSTPGRGTKGPTCHVAWPKTKNKQKTHGTRKGKDKVKKRKNVVITVKCVPSSYPAIISWYL